ncbi:MAG TPA: flavin-dependent oxidoreductase [Stellaceae bacterium]|nr:flavin-dependent oxidoreductase [Stellaceae bacterium]
MKVLIVGGGIGGLAAALCLHRRGIDCALYEQSETIRELGVGINTLPHAIGVLAELGLLERLDAVGIRTGELIYMNRFGQEILREKRGMAAGHPVPQFSIHRGRLQGVLHEAVLERLGPGAIHTGHRLVAVEQDAGGVAARFVGRREGGERQGSETAIRGDMLVAADGIHSAVRAGLFPDEGPPNWNGIMLWRGATEWPGFLTGQSMVVAGGMAAKLVLYPISNQAAPGHQLMNWAIAAQLGTANTAPPRREDWSRAGRLDDFMPFIERFTMPLLDLKALIAATPDFYEYPMCDRDPLPRWSHGRVTLLGDAAHPMYPVGSNGASQAILDAAALADCLADTADPVAALQAYDAERRPKTAEIVRTNRLGGPERVIDVVEERAPEGFERIEDVIPPDELTAIMLGYARLAGFAVAKSA